jgi:hypothetical protein
VQPITGLLESEARAGAVRFESEGRVTWRCCPTPHSPEARTDGLILGIDLGRFNSLCWQWRHVNRTDRPLDRRRLELSLLSAERLRTISSNV